MSPGKWLVGIWTSIWANHIKQCRQLLMRPVLSICRAMLAIATSAALVLPRHQLIKLFSQSLFFFLQAIPGG